MIVSKIFFFQLYTFEFGLHFIDKIKVEINFVKNDICIKLAV